MRTWILVAVVVVAKTAHADRCDDGVAALAKHDLPRAALYLDGCDDAQPAAVRDLRKQLDASNLSVLEVLSKPDKLEAEIDALPGEKFTTPATLYIPAGKHEVHAGDLKDTVTTKPHARSLVILQGAKQNTNAPKDGHADFREDQPDAPDPVGPPPPTPHKPMMPCKFTNSCTEAGEAIDDPLATHPGAPPPYPTLALDVRAGGVYQHGIGWEAQGIATYAPWTSEHPWFLSARFGVSEGSVLAIRGTFLAGKVIAAPDTAWISLDMGAAYDSYADLVAVAAGDITLRRLGFSVGAQYQQGIEATRERAVLLEVGRRIY